MHHTKNAKKAFECIVHKLKPSRIIVIGLYHKHVRFLTKIKQKLAKLIGKKLLYLIIMLEILPIQIGKSYGFKISFLIHMKPHTLLQKFIIGSKNITLSFLIYYHTYMMQKNLFKKHNFNDFSKFDDFMLMFDKNQIIEGNFLL